MTQEIILGYLCAPNGVQKLCTPNGVQMGYTMGYKEGAKVNLLVKDGDTDFLCTPKWGTKTMYPKWGTNGVQNGVHNGVQRGSRGEFVS